MTDINTTGYSLVFDPSFSTLSLESSSNPNGTWDTAYWWDEYNAPGSANFNGRTLPANNEAEFYSDSTVGVNPFSVNNGVLTITAAPATASMLATEAAANAGATLPYTSGLLTTATSFAQTYGLYEITAKLPVGQGLWPALWMLPASGAWPPELDILETYGDPTADSMTIHTGANNTMMNSTTQVPTAATAFNTYAVDWEPTTITFYVNGKQVFQEATPADMHQPMYMLMDLAVIGGTPNNPAVFPAQMQISSVQVYASPNTIADYNTTGVQTTPPPPPTYLPPVAEPDVFTGQENKAVTGNLMANNGNGAASDPNGLTLSVVAATLTTAHGGSVVENANGTFTYTPATGYTGTDSFNYTVEDSAGLTATGTASLTITAPPPTYTIPEPVIQALGGIMPAPTIVNTHSHTTLQGVSGSLNNVIIDESHNDTIKGDSGNDVLIGGTGYDKIYAGSGNNVLYSGTGNSNHLYAGSGNDTLIIAAGSGQDTMSAGTGSDVFILEPQSLSIHDVIDGFNVSKDKLDISALFGSSTPALHIETVSGYTGLYISSAGSTSSHLVVNFEHGSDITTHTALSAFLIT